MREARRVRDLTNTKATSQKWIHKEFGSGTCGTREMSVFATALRPHGRVWSRAWMAPSIRFTAWRTSSLRCIELAYEARRFVW